MEWISIKDEKPKKEGCYLFSTKTAGVCSGFVSSYSLNYKKPEVFVHGKGRQFTHWMPLPEPSKPNK
jgi:hypothetical protein